MSAICWWPGGNGPALFTANWSANCGFVTHTKPAQSGQHQSGLMANNEEYTMSLFQLGNCVITPAAQEFLEANNRSPQMLIRGHHDGSLWSSQNEAQNIEAVKVGDRVLTSISINDELLFIITEADRSSTCILLGSEY
jgi:hypothetical protein